MDETCPRADDLSAWLDDELGAAERARLDAHLTRCPACSAMLADLGGLRDDLQHLPVETLGFDLSEVIRGRLAASAAPYPARPRRRSWRDLLPVGVGATAALSAGLFMGLALTAGSGVAVAPRIAVMSVFDPVAPGGLCIGLDACYAPRGATRGIPR